jgi:hypothetical protein
VRLVPPDWLVYAAVVAGVLTVCLGRRERIMAPPAPPPVPGAAETPLAPDSPFAALPVVRVGSGPMRRGRTAFSVGQGGAWITADPGCVRPGVMVADGRAVAARPLRRAAGRIASLATPGAGTPGLPLARVADLSVGEAGYAVGYPRGGPGEVAARLMGPAELKAAARTQPSRAVMAWAELGQTAGLGTARPGLVGAPMLDAGGRVAGVVVGQAPRRGLLFTVPPPRGGRPQPAGAPISADNYGRAADDLRRALRVVQLVCLDR